MLEHVVDLRSTYGWTLSAHARVTASERGVAVHEILEVIADPHLTYSVENYGPGRVLYKRGDLAVVGAPVTRRVVTVLWSNPEPWTSEQFREHRSQRCA